MVVLYDRYVAQRSRQSPNEELHRGDVDPRFGARDRCLEILCQAAVSIEPSESSFHHPATRQQLKAGSISGAFDDLDSPVTELDQGVTQVATVVDAVGEQVAQPRKQLVDGLDDQHRPITILDI